MEKIDLSNIKSGCYLKSVAKYCPNIRSIICNNASSDGIWALSNYCRNISEFKVNGELIDYDHNDALGCLFSKNKNLQFLNIENSEFLTRACLLKLQLEEMI